MILSDLDNIVYNKFANGEITLAEYIKYQNRDKIMNYEQKYKEALGWMQSLYKGLHGITKEDAEHYFPELKESEDEQSRKWVLEYLYDGLRKSDEQFKGQFKTAIAWLEKQGEQPTDKVELKFKVGEWITNGDYTWKIVEVKPLDYILQSQDGNIVDDTISYVDKHFHLWSINEANDGDVLMTTKTRNCPFIYRKTDYNNNLAYYYAGVDGNGDFCEGCLKRTLYHFGSIATITPATKEQRELLFQKMKDSGYEWSDEKKELKKIEPKTLDANKVIAWLVANICDFEYYVKRFKQDFGI